jgi:hypothetical protein
MKTRNAQQVRQQTQQTVNDGAVSITDPFLQIIMNLLIQPVDLGVQSAQTNSGTTEENALDVPASLFQSIYPTRRRNAAEYAAVGDTEANADSNNGDTSGTTAILNFAAMAGIDADVSPDPQNLAALYVLRAASGVLNAEPSKQEPSARAEIIPPVIFPTVCPADRPALRARTAHQPEQPAVSAFSQTSGTRHRPYRFPQTRWCN